MTKRAKVLSNLIREKNYSRRGLAEKAGIPVTTLQSMLTRGIGGASIDNVIKVCKALDITVEELERMATCSTWSLLDVRRAGPMVKVAVVGTVTCGPNGLAYQEHEGHEYADESEINGGRYFYLKVQGESMTGDGIFEGDLVLVREQPDVEHGELAVVIVNGEEGTLKRVFKTKNSITLQASNPSFPPRVFVGADMEQVRIVGAVRALKRKFN